MRPACMRARIHDIRFSSPPSSSSSPPPREASTPPSTRPSTSPSPRPSRASSGVPRLSPTGRPAAAPRCRRPPTRTWSACLLTLGVRHRRPRPLAAYCLLGLRACHGSPNSSRACMAGRNSMVGCSSCSSSPPRELPVCNGSSPSSSSSSFSSGSTCNKCNICNKCSSSS